MKNVLIINKDNQYIFTNGSTSLWGNICVVQPQIVVNGLSLEEQKPRLYFNARFTNLFTQERSFKLDMLKEVPRMVKKGNTINFMQW